MTMFEPPPPPPLMTPGSAGLADSVQVLMTRVAALEAERNEMDDEIEKLRAQVRVLESERQWWRRWHIKWGPWFRAWRDGTSEPER